MNFKIKKAFGIIILSIILLTLTQYINVIAVKIPQQNKSPINNNDNNWITLIDGSKIKIVKSKEDKVLGYIVDVANPTKFGQSFKRIVKNGKTYIIPSGVDLSKIDFELFNIETLAEYEENGYIRTLIHVDSNIPPVIASKKGDIATLNKIENVKSTIKQLGGKVIKSYNLIPVILAKIPVEKFNEILRELSKLSEVKKIWLDYKVKKCLNESIPLIGGFTAWNLGFNGTNMRIAILDTGVYAEHPDFYYPDGTPKVELQLSFIDYDLDGIPDESPTDYNGHGTHCAGIAAGTGNLSSGNFTGVAPGAKIWNLKVLCREGWGYLNWILSAIEFASLGPDGAPYTGDEADVLSMSFGAPILSDGSDPLSLACDWSFLFAGRIPVTSAGNEGPDYFTVGIPAAGKYVIAVGASTKQDEIIWFSSCGPTLDLRVKPDVIAPGYRIWSTAARASTLIWYAEMGYIPGIDVDYDGFIDYIRISGTSMACPHVAGLAAVLKQMLIERLGLFGNETFIPFLVRNIIIDTANLLPGYDPFIQGSGRINVSAAVTTPIILDPAKYDLGIIEPNTTMLKLNLTLLYLPLAEDPSKLLYNTSIAVEPLLFNPDTGEIFDETVTVNVTMINATLGSATPFMVSINTSALPKGLYTLTLYLKDIYQNYTIHGLIDFAKMNYLMIEVSDQYGMPASNVPVFIYGEGLGPITSMMLDTMTYTDPNGIAYFCIPDANVTYVVWGEDKEHCADIFLFGRLFVNETVIESVSYANTISINYAMPEDQTLTSKEVVFVPPHQPYMYYSLWYYPSTPLTFITPTNETELSLVFEHIPSRNINPVDPTTINSNEWYELIFHVIPNETTILSINPNSTSYVTATYKVPHGTDRVSANALLFQEAWMLDWEFAWKVNAPLTRTEILTSGEPYHYLYMKINDLPNIITTNWSFEKVAIHPSGLSEIILGAEPYYPQLITYAYIESAENETFGVVELHGPLANNWFGDMFWNKDRDLSGLLELKVNNTTIDSIPIFGDYIDYSNVIYNLPANVTLYLKFYSDKWVATSGFYSWYSGRGDLLSNALIYLFNLYEVPNATLNFYTWYSIEPGWDFGYVLVSNDMGETWHSLDIFTGDSEVWLFKSYNLGPYYNYTDPDNSTLVVMFLYETDEYINYEGWYIDDIAVPEIGFLDNVEGPILAVAWNGWTIVRQLGEVYEYTVNFIITNKTEEMQVIIPLAILTHNLDEHNTIRISEANIIVGVRNPPIDVKLRYLTPSGEFNAQFVGIEPPSNYHFKFPITGEPIIKLTAEATVMPIENYTAKIIERIQNPFGVNLQLTQVNITLKKGWNLISIPVKPLNNTVEAIFGQLDFYSIWTWNPTAKMYEKPTVIEPGKGYWILVENDTSIIISGLLIEETEVPLKTGWNLIGSIYAPNTAYMGDVQTFYGKVYIWNAEKRMYEIVDSIPMGMGAWILAYTDTYIKLVPQPPSPPE